MTPTLETERLAIFSPDPALARRVVVYLSKNKDFFAPTSPPQAPRFYEEDFWQAHLATAQRSVADGASLPLYLALHGDADTIIGDMTLSNVVRGPFQAAYLGYKIDQAHQGKGLMFEALQALVQHAFETMTLHRIMANYIPTNERSARVLRRLGFVVEGYARDYLFIAGAWRDHVLTSLTNPKSLPPG